MICRTKEGLMNILLFGATGQFGRHILPELLKRGHQVAAFVRDPVRLAEQRSSVEVVIGDAGDFAAVVGALQGRSAVVSALGAAGFAGPDSILATGMRNIVAGMADLGVQRIVALASAGVLQADERTLRRDAPGYPAQFRPVSGEHLKAYEALAASDLDWTLVCPPSLVDQPRTGHFQVRADYYPAGVGMQITLEDLADFVADELERRAFSRHRVGIGS
jgi:putative NADH-flavin reductase